MIHKVTVTVGTESIARAVEAPSIPAAVRKALLYHEEDLPDVTIRVERGVDGMVLAESGEEEDEPSGDSRA